MSYLFEIIWALFPYSKTHNRKPMIKNNKKTENKTLQWVKFIVVLLLYIAFLIWLKSWLGIIVIPFIYDAYISKKIKWQWWKDAERPTRMVMSWVDAIVFALVAVYFINQFFFQNYVIPSSSLEKSLLTGDYLFVSKMSYGPRIPETPLTMPLTQHTLPIFKTQSYSTWPHWEYRRVKGLGKIQQNDIVVFNYPAGDSVMIADQYQAQDYYQYCYSFGKQQLGEEWMANDSMSSEQAFNYNNSVIGVGERFIKANRNEFGKIKYRPTDRRENYVKRCVGLPGQTLEIRNKIVYINGKANKEPDNVQYTYLVKLRQAIPDELLIDLQISTEDLISLNQNGYLPLTKHAYETLSARKDIVDQIRPITDDDQIDVFRCYPLNGKHKWTRDNYGPVVIPQKGMTIPLTMDNIAVYDRPIRVYEKNDLKVANGKIYINGKPANSYTFKMDYYWMMGDNRHNSADSRYWGFVPEDHIVGKPIFIWLSINPDQYGSKIRWNRLFRWVDNIR